MRGNSLDDYVDSDIKLGCYDTETNTLVGVMIVNKIDKVYYIESISWKLGIKVINGSTSMVEYLKGKFNPSSIEIDIDISKSTGNDMLDAGFKVTKITEPMYKLVEAHTNKVLTCESDVEELIEDEKLVEILGDSTFYKIYDSGRLRMTWTK
jgi:hypothetical protein